MGKLSLKRKFLPSLYQNEDWKLFVDSMLSLLESPLSKFIRKGNSVVGTFEINLDFTESGGVYNSNNPLIRVSTLLTL